MSELHHRSPHPSEPRLSSSLSSRGNLEMPPSASGKPTLSPLPSQPSFTNSSINMSLESDTSEKILDAVIEND